MKLRHRLMLVTEMLEKDRKYLPRWEQVMREYEKDRRQRLPQASPPPPPEPSTKAGS
jgi:hypothetical protein